VKFSKNKALAMAIVIILASSIVATLLPIVNAHDPKWEIPTYAYITVAPNPVGVDQQVTVFLFLTNYFYSSQFTNDYRFHNYKLTITSPSGQVTETTFAKIVDTTSAQGTTFTPTEVGTYTLNFTYPGQTITAADQPAGSLYVNDTFLASSASTTLTVQEDPIPQAITSYPLPSEYWTRPIYGENTDWWSISSNWLGLTAPNYGGWTATGADAAGGAYNGMAVYPGDAVGSQTSHVMWTKPLQSGGVVGGNNTAILGQTYFDGSAYLIRYNNPIILDGMLYYSEPLGFSNTGYGMMGLSSGQGPTVCVDLRTGEEIWSRIDVPALSMGLTVNVQTQNQHGVSPPILIAMSGTTWMGYDADTGNWLFNVTNVPSYPSGSFAVQTNAARVMGPDGEYLNYIFTNLGNSTNPNWYLAQWNSSRVFIDSSSYQVSFTGIKDGSIKARYDWNVSSGYSASTLTVVGAKYKDGILAYSGKLPSNGENQNFATPSQTPYTYYFINLNPAKGTVGSVLWSKTLNPPANNYTVVQGGIDWDTRVFLQSYKEATKWVAYSLTDGSLQWTGEPQAAFDYYGSTSAGVLSGQIAYGKLYSSGMGGILYCYDMKTGSILWTYGNGGAGNSTNSGFAWPYGNIPTFIQAIGNNVVYLITSEHTWVSPIYKDGLARAINATDGSEIWTISSVTMEFGKTSYAMADGFNTWFNGYDNQIYVVGRGPSATTVSASPKVQNQGSSVIIEGTVTDISSGTTQDEQSARFPNGVPVASDTCMTDWMGYVYQQKPIPSAGTGVSVSLSVVDANGNYRSIGTATTDLSGAYSYQWTPDIPGKYIVYASFAGTNAYWPSSSQTSFAVDAIAPTPTQSPSVIATSNDPMYFVGSTIAIIIAIAIVGFLILRKRV
jgi:hypothetical protein